MKFSTTFYQLLLLFIVNPELIAQSPNVICPGTNVTFEDFSENDHQFWNAVYYWDPAISSHDIGEAETDLTLSAKVTCGAAQDLKFRYVLFLDLNYDGVMETFIDSDSLPEANKIYIGNKPTDLFSGTLSKFDFQNVPAQLYWKFDLSTQTSGDTVTAHIIWKNFYNQSTLPKMPYGTHYIKWYVKDGCGNESVCEYGFSVKDAQKPTVFCLDTLTVNIMNTSPPALQLWASDFLQYMYDNHTPNELLRIGIREKGSGTGFPYNSDGTPKTSVLFGCGDIGNHVIELWSVDKSGNADYCETTVEVYDFLWACEVPIMFNGEILTPLGEGIKNVSMEVNVYDPGFPSPIIFPSLTDEDGRFWEPFSWPPSSNATISPVLKQDYLNGLNTWDLVLISRHILGLEPLNSPYKLISADANKSGTITTFDLIELRRLMLGTYVTLPNNNSWRFVDKDQVFSDPANPFADTIRESLVVQDIFSNPEYDFIGCKIGDVDYTAAPHFQGEPEERFYDLQTIALHDKAVKAGESFTVHLQTPAEITGTQMTFSGKGLTINEIRPSENCTQDNFAIFGNDDAYSTSPLFTAAFERGVAEFEVEFTATQDGTLSEMLNISNDITPAMAFSESGERYDLALHFIKANDPADTPVFYQNTPNPWQESTKMQFSLPEEGDVNIVVTDQNGSTVLQRKAHFAEGLHQVVFEKSQFPASGVYYVRMQTGVFSAVQKMIFFKN